MMTNGVCPEDDPEVDQNDVHIMDVESDAEDI